MLPEGSLITVFGGSGFVGRNAVRLLARRGYRIRSAERRPDLAGHLQPLGGPGQIVAVQANVRDAASVRRAVAGSAAVVNLVAILAEGGRQTFEALHVKGAQTIARATREASVPCLVHVSAIGASASSPSRYGKSKAKGEQAVLAEFPGAVILRPSVIFGPGDDLFNRFAAMAKSSPILPVIAGKTKLQPVYVDDVGAAIVAAIEGGAKPGVVYELGGPEVVTLRELMQRTLRYSGQHRPLAGLPSWLAKLIGFATMPLPNALRPFTVDQLRMLALDNVVSPSATSQKRTLAGLGITQPQTMDALVPSYLERFNPRGQYAHYRGLA